MAIMERLVYCELFARHRKHLSPNIMGSLGIYFIFYLRMFVALSTQLISVTYIDIPA